MNENNYKIVVFRNANSGVCATIDGKRAYPDRSWKPAPLVGEYWTVEVVGKNRDETVYFVKGIERIEPRIIKEDEKQLPGIIPPMGSDYCVVEVETRRNIKNTYGGGTFFEGLEINNVAYCYGDENCTESLSYGRHGARHYFYTIFCKPGTAAAERFLKQQARFARESEEKEAAEKLENERQERYLAFKNSNLPIIIFVPGFNREMFDLLGEKEILKIANEKYSIIDAEFKRMFEISIDDYLNKIGEKNRERWEIAWDLSQKMKEGRTKNLELKAESYPEFSRLFRHYIMNKGE